MVVDTSALVAILLQEEDVEVYAREIAGAPAALLSAVCHVELAIVALSRGARGRAELDATLVDSGIEIVALGPDQARLAADAYATYGKGRHPAGLSFGDFSPTPWPRVAPSLVVQGRRLCPDRLPAPLRGGARKTRPCLPSSHESVSTALDLTAASRR